MLSNQFGCGDNMSKRITISNEMYFKLLELKAKIKTDSLLTILALADISQSAIMVNRDAKDTGQVANLVISSETKEPIKPIRQDVTIFADKPNKPNVGFSHNQPEQPNNLLCTCGHPENYHASDGCLGDGSLCACKQFTAEQGA
jgi:hypothetical protein